MVTREKVVSIVDSILSSYKPYLVYKQFVDYYGEEFVDLQHVGSSDVSSLSVVIDNIVSTYNEQEIGDELLKNDIRQALSTNHFLGGSKHILVRWPSVTIKNERDNEILIKELYAKVQVTSAGYLSGYFYLNRADYPISHARYNYMHSHVRDIPMGNPTEFQNCCLGSGPIRDTIASLNNSDDLDRWALFCLELNRYVHVESLTGGPYHRMSEVHPLNATEYAPLYYPGYTNNITFDWYRLDGEDTLKVKSLLKEITPEFVKFLIDSKIIQFKFVNGAYAIAQSETDALLAISDAFIDWYNLYNAANPNSPTYHKLLDMEVLFKTVMRSGKLYAQQGGPYNVKAQLAKYRGYLQDKRICYFKGQAVTVNIHPDQEDEAEASDNNQITVLNPSYVSYLLNNIVKFINSKNLNNATTN